MRFKDPNYGDIRIKRSFLLFPKVINRETRWLEIASWKEEFVMGVGWSEKEWIN